MSDVTGIDRDPQHLYPDFRLRIFAVLREVEKATGEPWEIVEGFRSVTRQLWLYGQGRPGFQPYGRPGSKVTWKRSPTWHGTGLAADLRPQKSRYQAPQRYWDTLRRVGAAHGLQNPAWGNGDLGHLQLTDYTQRRKALNWIDAGRPVLQLQDAPAAPSTPLDLPPGAPAPSFALAVYVNGVAVVGAAARYAPGSQNTTLVRLRPVAQALSWDVVSYDTDHALCVYDDDLPGTEGPTTTLPIFFFTEADGKHAYARSAEVAAQFHAEVHFDATASPRRVAFASLAAGTPAAAVAALPVPAAADPPPAAPPG